MNSRANRVFGSPRRTFEPGTIGIIALVVLTAATAYFVLHPPRKQGFEPPPVVSRDGPPRPVRHRQFDGLFASDIPLSRLARTGQYTVVEVYVDDCSYCREFEGAFGAFNKQRTDVSLFRVHHPGEIAIQAAGRNDDEVRQALATFDARMAGYGVCASPHIEVYGSDRELLARDACDSRSGTMFMWDWIGHETGLESRLPVKGNSILKEGPNSMGLVAIFLGIELAYLLLLAIQGFLGYSTGWWDRQLRDS